MFTLVLRVYALEAQKYKKKKEVIISEEFEIS